MKVEVERLGKQGEFSTGADRNSGSNTQKSRKTSENLRAWKYLTKSTPKSITNGNGLHHENTPDIPRYSERTLTTGAKKHAPKTSSGYEDKRNNKNDNNKNNNNNNNNYNNVSDNNNSVRNTNNIIIDTIIILITIIIVVIIIHLFS